jgi:DNA-binding transcriptional LysR family regulator
VDENQLPVDFRHLETFCRVAELKSFTKAAEDLCLTQPTVSGHILLLEQSLSLRLFDRNGRTVCLTKAGEVFLRFASKIISSRRDLFNALSEFSQGISGELSLGASTIPGEYLLPKLMVRFKKEHPHGILSLKVADTKDIVQYVLEGTVELGIIGAKLAIPSLHFDRYEEDEIIIVAPSGHPLANKKKIGFERLMQEPWIIREAGSGTQMAVEKALGKIGKSLKQFNIVMKMGSTSSLKEGVKSGLGLAFISQKAVGDELDHGLLSRIRSEEIEPISRQFYIVYRRGKTFSPMGTKFFRFLKEHKEKG